MLIKCVSTQDVCGCRPTLLGGAELHSHAHFSLSLSLRVFVLFPFDIKTLSPFSSGIIEIQDFSVTGCSYSIGSTNTKVCQKSESARALYIGDKSREQSLEVNNDNRS